MKTKIYKSENKNAGNVNKKMFFMSKENKNKILDRIDLNKNITIKTNRKKVLSNLKLFTDKEINNKKQLINKIKENKDKVNNKDKDKQKEIIKSEDIKYKSFNYNSNNHKHLINCNYNFMNKENKISQYIIAKGYCHYLPNKTELNAIDSQLKIITVRNTDIGITDNLNNFNKPINNYGYPFKRKIYNDTIKNSKDKLELRLNRLYYGNELIDNKDKLIELHKDKEIITLLGKKMISKKYLSEYFISKIYRDYLYFINDNKTKFKFNYHKIKNKQKVISGIEFLEIFKDFIKIIKTNNKNYENTKSLLLKSLNKNDKLKTFIENNTFYDKNLYTFKENYIKVYKIIKGKKELIYNKTLNKEMLNLFDKFLSLLLNNKRIYHKNGMYKFNLTVLNNLIKDIELNGILNYTYELKRLNGLKLVDNNAINKDKVDYWLKQNITLLKKSKDYNILSKSSKYWIEKQKDKQKQLNYCRNRIKEIKQLHNQ